MNRGQIIIEVMISVALILLFGLSIVAVEMSGITELKKMQSGRSQTPLHKMDLEVLKCKIYQTQSRDFTHNTPDACW